ncbi:lysophospholipid acyltransferase family protein [Nocardia asteroides]|uniref:lysophospholipid acyltransferase family protein n=1 Tax=Nocardia asteroides TaxID=1824 RepID=UPI0037C8CFB0
MQKLLSRIVPGLDAAPEVAPDNFEAVYGHYRASRGNPVPASVICAAASLKLKPRVHYADGVEENLEDLITGNRRIILSLNHPSERDPFSLAAVAWRSTFRPRIGRFAILTKDGLFRTAARPALDSLGCIPVFRGKNHGTEVARTASRSLVDACLDRMTNGDDIAVFPEGTCNTSDPMTVLPIGKGVGHLASAARAEGLSPVLAFVGLAYDCSTDTPCFYFDTPIVEFPMEIDDITSVVEAGMQKALTYAVEKARRTPPRRS